MILLLEFRNETAFLDRENVCFRLYIDKHVSVTFFVVKNLLMQTSG